MIPAEWLSQLEARWPGVASHPPAHALEGTDGADLLLAAACLAGDARALAYLEALLVNEVRRAVAPLDTTNVLVDEVTQLVRERLLMAPPRLAHYSGQGSLASWIRAVAVRIALNAKRPGAREDPVSSVPDNPLADADPELALLRSRYRDAFRTAFSQAVETLTPRERTLMRLTALDGLTCAQVGQVYGKDASTVSRWLASSRAALLEKTRQLLSTTLQLTPSGLDSLMRLADSELDLSISRLLESRA